MSGSFRIETFGTRAEMVSHLAGGLADGFRRRPGPSACTIGQGVTGVSTLAAGSLIAVASIIFGSAITMKVEYHMLDEKGFRRRARNGAEGARDALASHR